jgi:hypothetical protein
MWCHVMASCKVTTVGHACCRSTTTVTPAAALPRIDEVCAVCVSWPVAAPFNVAAAQLVPMCNLSVCVQNQELRAEMRAFEQRMRALVAQKGVVVGESATTLGEQVVRMATREQLVTVTDVARRAAEGLLWRAGQVGVQVRRATRLQSRLKEAGSAGVQQLVSELVKAQPPGQLCQQWSSGAGVLPWRGCNLQRV